jgi:hypothetical protein
LLSMVLQQVGGDLGLPAGSAHIFS